MMTKYQNISSFQPVLVLWILVVNILLSAPLVNCNDSTEQKRVQSEGTTKINLDCDENEPSCKKDKLSLTAINELHHMIDDDQDGNVNQQESKGFLKEELQYSGGTERLAIFHNNDSLISVDDLWKAWTRSEVFNWTVDDVVTWLESHVRLPQYSATFRANNIDGRALPSIAVTKGSNVLKTELGIKNGIHRQKITVQAMDLVLFGPPKDAHNVLKDILLILATFFVVCVSWFAYSQKKKAHQQVERMLREMEKLQKADDALKEVQNKLSEAEEIKQTVTEQKTKLELKYQDEISMAKKEAERLKVAREGSMEEISRLKLAEEELVQVRGALKRAEKELERAQWATPATLRNWLQLTYEIELEYFNRRKLAADMQFKLAREECERMSRKRGGLLGSLRVATSSSMDEMDHQIEEARAALEDVKHNLDERLQRWHNIEQICGFPIASNPGKDKLQQILQIGVPRTSPVDVGFRNVEEGELDEDIPPGYPGTALMHHTKSSATMRPPPYPGYPVPGTSTPLRPHNLPNALKNSMGVLGSNSSLPRMRTPKKRNSCDSDDVSIGKDTPSLSDVSHSDKPMFSLESSPTPENVTNGTNHTTVSPVYQPMKVSQSLHTINHKHYSDTIGGLGYIQNHKELIRTNRSLEQTKRSHSDANLEKLNNAPQFTTSNSLDEKSSKSAKKKFFKIFQKKQKS